MTTLPTPQENGAENDGAQFDTTEMARALYEDAGIDWPDWVAIPDGPDDVDGEVGDEIGGEVENANGQVVSPVSDSPAIVKIGERELPVDQATALLGWHDYLTSNPDKAPTIIAIMRGENVIPQPPNPNPTNPTNPDPNPTPATPPVPVIPEGFDPEDPRDKWLLDRMNYLATTTDQLAQLTKQQVEQNQQQRAQSDMALAMQTFKSSHPGFTDEDIRHIASATANLGIVNGLVSRNQSNPVKGIVEALEAGMWVAPTIREKLIANHNPNPAPTTTADTDRQAKLSALSGRSGSTPRTNPPTRLDSDSAMKEAIAKAVEPMFNS